MNHFEFEYPYLFLALLLIICIYKCPKSIQEIIFPHTHLFSTKTSILQLEKLLYSAIVALIVTALASPISYDQKSSNKRKGRDLVFALDTSGSMAERGFDKEDRDKKKFDILNSLLKEFIAKRHDDNVGVSIFGSYAYSAVPLTYDMSSLEFLLDFFEVGIAGDSTAIGEGIAAATRVIEAGEAKKKVIILVTDGYQNSGAISIKAATKKAKELDIKIYAIGIGKKSDYDFKLLSLISSETNAKAFQATSAEILKDVYIELDSLEPSSIRSEHYLNKHVLYMFPLTLALLLMLFILLRFRGRSI
ncbi:VWA domain-containing protein [Sulfurimonas aquatica]|uniref:VWA domain-containing protein n=1 Tax=Sulfurimonas aquatica TaxID=2672570 RepID=A0A975B1C4_9BACT|nr:VWA domain-containing protein [Sulfurimonas aquatica]QSZ42421.1 VWA domain-containing protein [Sulfurimonas aquatica]